MKLAHTMIRVRDLDATLQFYCDFIGLEEIRRKDIGDEATLVWLADVVWWWRAGRRYYGRGRALLAAEHAFLLFMIFNATVVFEQGAARVGGLVVTAAGLAALIAALRRRKV